MKSKQLTKPDALDVKEKDRSGITKNILLKNYKHTAQYFFFFKEKQKHRQSSGKALWVDITMIHFFFQRIASGSNF